VTATDALTGRWRERVDGFFATPAGVALDAILQSRQAAGAVVYPPQPFNALTLTPFESVRAVILGQDPYHGAGQAHGLAFSVQEGVAPPPSLRNIFAELASDLGCKRPRSGNLTPWAGQGVLLLNAVLTVEEGKPASHARRGWEVLTDALIVALAEDAAPKVFLLWGAYAQAKRSLIDAAGNGHFVLTANHPSPLAARKPPQPFIGCRHFSQANEFLEAQGRGAIAWCLP
jgi:uracil-DNA glycosylase